MSNNHTNPVNDVIYPEQVTRDWLYDLFISAYLDAQRDTVEDVYIKDTYTVWVFPQKDGQHIRLMIQFRANAEAPRSAKLEYVNSINDEYKVVRAYVDADNDIGFDYFIAIEGGITKRTIIMAIRRFIEYVRIALQQDQQGVLD